MTRAEHEQCIKLVIDHWRNRYLALEKQLEAAKQIHGHRLTKTFRLADRDRLVKQQEEYFRKADQYQRYLAGFISSRRMCELVGFPEDKNMLAPVLQRLQMAHDEPKDRGFKERLEFVLGGLEVGLIDGEAAHQLLGMAPQEVSALLFGTPKV